jgi:hypothetical protein
MYSLFSRVPLSLVASRELPALFAAFVIAELFYKFHSFTLECAAFLATWYGLSWIADRILWRKG